MRSELTRGAAVVTALCLTGLLAMVLAVPGTYAGPVVVSVRERGLHLLDVPALFLWLVGVLGCATTWRLAGRGPRD
ncbi:hypothetical protein INN71_05135 [Nocardioides sp. ChNu-153]|uniref:hypothetical protein n=1 Tax=unclassified Nocardioides TaxID=2615069 RepID=UPI00240529A9|nr:MULTISPECIES: hypothetical protein [unclassified Nocardioides]MDF9717648.1 hypothetical protein [Nocardioides sp. ChNu-99]MDN7120772.1 hypothetical protein [Nocardioides sp. ChNu-153]